MNITKSLIVFKALFLISTFAVSVYAQEQDTAYIPFLVNVDAKVKAERGTAVFERDVEANKVDTLKVVVEKGGFTSISRQVRRQQNSPVRMAGANGKISLNLPANSYRNADISLYSLSGKRILRTTVDVSQTAKSITQPNLVAGVYLLSVKGVNGQSFSNRLTHKGGNLNINVTFGDANFSNAPQITAANTSVIWTITISAQGYADSSYTLNLTQGINNLQTTTLNPNSGTFIDDRDDREYRWVKIGTQIWMAENLNYGADKGEDGGDIGVCYDDDSDNCDIYGRLYSWAEAMDIDLVYNSSTWGDSDVNHQGICPVGWHVSNRTEWLALTSFVGIDREGTNAGTKLKSQTGWNTNPGNELGTDDFGFSALPGGYNRNDGFSSIGSSGYWWRITEVSASNAWYQYMGHNSSETGGGNFNKTFQLSIRCIKTVGP